MALYSGAWWRPYDLVTGLVIRYALRVFGSRIISMARSTSHRRSQDTQDPCGQG